MLVFRIIVRAHEYDSADDNYCEHGQSFTLDTIQDLIDPERALGSVVVELIEDVITEMDS